MKKLALILTSAIMILSCKPNADKAAVIEDSKQATIDSMNTVMEKQKIELAQQKSIDSMKGIVETERAKRVSANHRTNAAYAAPSAPVAAAEPKRKGWSGAAKGAVIGAGVGAIGGAIIDKKKPAQGAIIGGLAGAGVGAGTGAIIDSKKKN